MKRVLFLGLGRIGLPTALLSSNKKNVTIGYDINTKLIQNLKKGILSFNEDRIKKLLISKVKQKKISFTNNIMPSDIYVIAVPTPLKKNKKADLSYVFNCISKIINVLKAGDLIILESTVPIGTTNFIKSIIDKKHKKLKNKYYLSYCPERILPGDSIKELKNNARIIGGINNKSNQLSINFYNSFLKVNYYKTNSKIAEMIKLSENSYRDTNIAFANELMRIADKHKIRINNVIKGANFHPRVNILKPGIGVGGHCIPIDPYFILENYKENTSIIKSSREINNFQTNYIFNKFLKYLNSFNHKNLSKIKIGLLGLAYKANTDDIRESPSINFVNLLQKKNFKNISYHDPFIKKIPLKGISRKNIKLLVNESDIIVKLVNHSQYIKINKIINLKNKNFLSIDNGFN